MIQKEIDNISLDDIFLLKKNEVFESKTIEYKREIHVNTDSEKKEFLRDVCSFCNAEGGDLIIGIEELDGKPKEIVGIEIEEVDIYKQRLDHIILSGIEPNISYSIHTVKLPKLNRYILIIRIKKSWNGPHRVCYKSEFRFYSRNSSGKYSLDMTEIKSAFYNTNSNLKQIEEFRQDRISQIYSGYQNMERNNLSANIVLHIVPLNCFSLNTYYDISLFKENNLNKLLKPITPYSKEVKGRWNFDGYLTYNSYDDLCSYTQLYRNGIIESVGNLLYIHSVLDRNRKILGNKNEDLIVDYIQDKCLYFLNKLGVQLPILIYVSILGIEGYSMDITHIPQPLRQNLSLEDIDRDIILLKEVVVSNHEDDIKKSLKPVFDVIWNTCGIRRI